MGNCLLCYEDEWHTTTVQTELTFEAQISEALKDSHTLPIIHDALQRAYDSIPEPQVPESSPPAPPLAVQPIGTDVVLDPVLKTAEQVKKEVSQTLYVRYSPHIRQVAIHPNILPSSLFTPKSEALTETNENSVTHANSQKQVQHTVLFGQKLECSYTGPLVDGCFQGEGLLTTPEGFYKGNFRKGKKSGKGIFRWKIGRKYIGDYKNDLKEGYGQIYNTDGTLSYQGQWKNDLPNGQGVGYVNSVEYPGIWCNGQIKVKKKHKEIRNPVKDQSIKELLDKK